MVSFGMDDRKRGWIKEGVDHRSRVQSKPQFLFQPVDQRRPIAGVDRGHAVGEVTELGLELLGKGHAVGEEIGLGLTGFGIFFSFLGVLFFFYKGLLAMGNILFLSGVMY